MLEELQKEFLHQVNTVLPELARRTGKYPVIYNHCWSRILYDNLFNTCWYNKLDTTQGAAYKQLTEDQLRTLLTWCDEIKKSPKLADLMNSNSLRWRQEYV